MSDAAALGLLQGWSTSNCIMAGVSGRCHHQTLACLTWRYCAAVLKALKQT